MQSGSGRTMDLVLKRAKLLKKKDKLLLEIAGIDEAKASLRNVEF